MGFSTTTGNLLWTTTTPEINNHMYGVSGGIYDGVMYSGDSIAGGGIIYAYNATTGKPIFQTSPGPFQAATYTGTERNTARRLYWNLAS
jgi:outer membrane protein assembly factor BamB